MRTKQKIADTNGGKVVMAEGKDLLQVLWSGADVLRGKMDVLLKSYQMVV